MYSIKNLFYSFLCLSFLITSCSGDGKEPAVDSEDDKGQTVNPEDDKEHTIAKFSRWTQTIEDTTHAFQLLWSGGWTGSGGKEKLVEHGGECRYHSYPKGEDPGIYLIRGYKYDRDGDSIKIYGNVPNFDPRNAIPDSIVWLKGHIANDTMFVSNATQAFQLQKAESYEAIE